MPRRSAPNWIRKGLAMAEVWQSQRILPSGET